jgi:hypothetical protein
MFIRPRACANHSAFERCPDEKAFGFAVGINCRSRRHVGFCSASDRPGRDTRVRTERHVSSFGKCANRAFIVKHNDKIGHFRADLEPPTCAARADKRRPDQPCPVRATTTPSPAFPLKMKPAFTTLMMARPCARRRIRDGIPFSGMCRNSRIVTAEPSTVSCSVALAEISDKQEIIRMRLNVFIDAHLFRATKYPWPYFLVTIQTFLPC